MCCLRLKLPDKLHVAIRIISLVVRLKFGFHIVRVNAHFEMVFIAAGRPIANHTQIEKKKKERKKDNKEKEPLHFQPSTFRHPFALGA